MKAITVLMKGGLNRFLLLPLTGNVRVINSLNAIAFNTIPVSIAEKLK